MANDGTGNNWDEGDPLGNLPARDGQVQIRDLRKGTRQRTGKEHTTFASGGEGGEHKAGSAKVYRQTAAPTKRPDGETVLDANDEGRIWIDDTGLLKYRKADNTWAGIFCTGIIDGAVTTAKIADGAVTTPKIPDLAITTAKIASGAVTGAQIQDGAVSASKLADGNVTPVKIQNNSLGSGQFDATTNGTLGIRVKKGNYTGNGTTNKAITGLGFLPDFIFIVDLATGQLSILSQTFGTVVVIVNSTITATGTMSLDADGFTIKTSNANVNTNGRIYGWLAMKVNA